MKTLRISLLLLVLLLIVPAALAQTGGQESPGGSSSGSPAVTQLIASGTPVTVHLDGTTPAPLIYKSAGNEVISVTARSLESAGVLNPTLSVLDPTGATLASNDDHGTDRTDLSPTDSLVSGVSLPTVGRYTIEVANLNDGAQGNVEVQVSLGGASQPTAVATANNGANETSISDRVPNNGPYTYDFQGSAGQVLTITVRAGDNQLDPKVSLLDSGGNELASNDDHESADSSLGPYDSQIVGFTIPKTDTYTIQITGFAGIGGAFTLTIDSGGGSQPVPTPTSQAPIITPTPVPENNKQVVTGSINPNDVYTYHFDGQPGEVYTITVQAATSDFDPRVSVYLGDKWVADNDDYGSTDPSLLKTDSRIYDLILKDAGSYEVDVRGYGDSSGAFTLTVERVATNAPTGDPTEQVVLGTIKSGETYTYQFDAQAGDWVTITARGLTLNFDSYVTLISADGTVLIDNDDNGTTASDVGYYDSRIPNYHIATSGTYTVQVTGVDGIAGTFGLTIGTLR